MRVAAAVLVAVLAAIRPASLQSPLDDSDRAAFRAWFTFLADAEFERTDADVVDCAALVRHAYREALRRHTPEWYRRSGVPLTAQYPDVRHAPPAKAGRGWPLFRIAADPDRFAEFADAAALARLNARRIARNADAARPGDLLYFRQDADPATDHLMVFIGRSQFESRGDDWVVYHTGPDSVSRGEVRKTSLRDLLHHPSPRWRPVRDNPAFVGVLRLSIVDAER